MQVSLERTQQMPDNQMSKFTTRLQRFFTIDVAIKSAGASWLSGLRMLIVWDKTNNLLITLQFIFLMAAFLICVILAPAIEELRK